VQLSHVCSYKIHPIAYVEGTTNFHSLGRDVLRTLQAQATRAALDELLRFSSCVGNYHSIATESRTHDENVQSLGARSFYGRIGGDLSKLTVNPRVDRGRDRSGRDAPAWTWRLTRRCVCGLALSSTRRVDGASVEQIASHTSHRERGVRYIYDSCTKTAARPDAESPPELTKSASCYRA